MSAPYKRDTLEEIRNMCPLDKLVREYMWGQHINGTWFFHQDPKIDEARQGLSDLRDKVASLESRLAEALERNVRLESENKLLLKRLMTHIIVNSLDARG
jgi:hypothetical protein